MLINTNNLPVDLAAECLRQHCFNTGYECKLNDVNINDLNDKFSNFIASKIDDGNFYVYSGNGLVVAFQHDGDTTLIIIDIYSNVAYVNFDAKKTHGWKKTVIS